jgi:hypothetical protein
VSARFKLGDCVIYRKQKSSTRPGPNAKEIYPAPNGDSYSYEVDKFWKVVALHPGTKEIIVCTRRGKQLTLNEDDPALRRAHWLERFLFRSRFPQAGLERSHAANDQLTPVETPRHSAGLSH